MHSIVIRNTAPTYARGFETLDRELEVDNLTVSGRLPEWLEGTLLRTGPARFEVGGESYRHWFDGLAMLHAFSFAGGRATYRNRQLRSLAHEEAISSGRISRGEFGTNPCLSAFGRVLSLFSPRASDNGNVNVIKHGERWFALGEAPARVEFDGSTLETIATAGFADGVGGQLSTAHPLWDATHRSVINYNTDFGERCGYTIYALPEGEERRRPLAFVPSDAPSYMHSFGMTDRYVILAELPHVVNPMKMKLRDRPFIEGYRWAPSRGTRFTVVRKEDGKIVARSEADAFFSFHHVNAFEDGDELAVDLVAYEDSSIIDSLYLDRLRGSARVHAVGELRRYRVPLDARRSWADHEVLSDVELELPRIAEARSSGRRYRFVYGAGELVRGNFMDSIVKIDVETGAGVRWSEKNCYPGEPVFVASPSDRAEDDGVVLSLVLDAEAGESFLVVLDAHTLHERARVRAPHVVPFGFHGQFFGARR